MLSEGNGQGARLSRSWLVSSGACLVFAMACGSRQSTVVTVTPTEPEPPGQDTERPEPSCGDATLYEPREVADWAVCVRLALLEEQPEVADAALSLLAQDLDRIQGFTSPAVWSRLRSTTIWLERDVPAWPGAVYHPSAAWLTDNGYPAYWAGGIQLGNAANYLTWTDIQPAMVFHELAHTWHDQVLGYDHPEILAAFDAAMTSGLYDEVAYAGGGLQPAYATTNAVEYFAELSESLFWVNDFYPFTAGELQQHDAQGHAAIVAAWSALEP